jgi:hypothetical protein
MEVVEFFMLILSSSWLFFARDISFALATDFEMPVFCLWTSHFLVIQWIYQHLLGLW